MLIISSDWQLNRFRYKKIIKAYAYGKGVDKKFGKLA